MHKTSLVKHSTVTFISCQDIPFNITPFSLLSTNGLRCRQQATQAILLSCHSVKTRSFLANPSSVYRSDSWKAFTTSIGRKHANIVRMPNLTLHFVSAHSILHYPFFLSIDKGNEMQTTSHAGNIIIFVIVSPPTPIWPTPSSCLSI